MPVALLTKADFSPRSATEAGRHFAKKAALTDEAFEKLSAKARAHAFRVAGVHKARMIQELRNRVEEAIEKGEDWSAVQRELLKKFDTAAVPRPALARLRTMFLQNAMQSYNDARREVLDEAEVVDAFPFRMYLTVGDGTPGVNGVRPTHAALHGKIFAWDDPFWDAHTPPWDWGCRCTFVPLTAGQVRSMGEPVLDLGYVRKRLEVPGTRQRGIPAKPGFERGKFNLKGIEKELREAVEEMLKG